MSPALEKFPSLTIFSGWIASLALYHQGIAPLLSGTLSLLVTLGFALVFTRNTPKRFWKVLFLAVLVSFSGAFWMDQGLSRPESFPEKTEVSIMGTVLSSRTWGNRFAVVLGSSEERFLMFIKPPATIMEGDRLHIEGYAFPLRDNRKDTFNEILYWKSRGVVREIIPGRISPVKKDSPSIHTWRSALRRKIDLQVPQFLRGYLLASWLGIKDPELRERHGRWGTSHLLAVSGFHVGILAGLLWLLLPRGPAGSLIISFFLWAYVLFTGLSPSAVRAAMMLQMILLGDLLNRPLNAINSVAVACMAMLLFNPWIFWDLGWRLSVTAAFTIASFSGMSISPGKAFLLSPLIWITTAPLVTGAFGAMPVAGLLINLAAIPLYGLLFPVFSVMGFFYLLDIPFPEMAVLPLRAFLSIWNGTCDLVCRIIPCQLTWHPLLVFFSASVIMAMISISTGSGWKRTTLALLAVNLLVSSLSTSLVV